MANITSEDIYNAPLSELKHYVKKYWWALRHVPTNKKTVELMVYAIRCHNEQIARKRESSIMADVFDHIPKEMYVNPKIFLIIYTLTNYKKRPYISLEAYEAHYKLIKTNAQLNNDLQEIRAQASILLELINPIIEKYKNKGTYTQHTVKTFAQSIIDSIDKLK